MRFSEIPPPDWKAYARCEDCGVDPTCACRDEHDQIAKEVCPGRPLKPGRMPKPPPVPFVYVPKPRVVPARVRQDRIVGRARRALLAAIEALPQEVDPPPNTPQERPPLPDVAVVWRPGMSIIDMERLILPAAFVAFHGDAPRAAKSLGMGLGAYLRRKYMLSGNH